MKVKRKNISKKVLTVSVGGTALLVSILLLVNSKKVKAKPLAEKKQEKETTVKEVQPTKTTQTPSVENTVASDKHWILGGRPLPAPKLSNTNTRLITMNMQGACDLTPTGKYRGPRTAAPKFIVVHWGGSDLNNLCAVFKGGREASSNVGTGRDSNGDPVIVQFLDLNAIAWHAGEWRNELSIGLDVAQDPTQTPDFYTSRGYDVRMMDNRTGRGDLRCLTIDPVIKKATQDAIISLCALFGIPLQVPRGADGRQKEGALYYGKLDDNYIKNEFRGVLGHFHTSNNKWDIAPWWEDVMTPILNS